VAKGPFLKKRDAGDFSPHPLPKSYNLISSKKKNKIKLNKI